MFTNHLLPHSIIIFIWELLIDLIFDLNYELPVCIFVKFKERSFIVPGNLMLFRSVKGSINKVHVHSVIQTLKCITVNLCIHVY